MSDTPEGNTYTQLDRIELKLSQMETKVDAAYQSSEKIRKYMMWTAIITVACIVIPLFILPFVLPSFLASQGVGDISNYSGF